MPALQDKTRQDKTRQAAGKHDCARLGQSTDELRSADKDRVQRVYHFCQTHISSSNRRSCPSASRLRMLRSAVWGALLGISFLPPLAAFGSIWHQAQEPLTSTFRGCATQGLTRQPGMCALSWAVCSPGYLPGGTVVQAGVVLGYALQRDGTPTPTLAQRVVTAVRLYDSEAAEHLVFSGGHPGEACCLSALSRTHAWQSSCWCLTGGGLRNRSEAAVMEDLALQLTTTTKANRRSVMSSQLPDLSSRR